MIGLRESGGRLTLLVVALAALMALVVPVRAEDELGGLLEGLDGLEADLPALDEELFGPDSPGTGLPPELFDGREPPVAEAGTAASRVETASAALDEVWDLLHALSIRVRQDGFRPPVTARLLALDLGMEERLSRLPSTALAEVARERWRRLREALASTVRVSPAPLEEALDGPLGAELQEELGQAELARDAAEAERGARRREARAAGLLDGLLYSPLPADALLGMLDSGKPEEIDRALEEIRDRGTPDRLADLVPGLSSLGDVRTAERVLETLGRHAEEEALAALEAMAVAQQGAGEASALLPWEAGPVAEAPPGRLAAAAREASARIRGRMQAGELLRSSSSGAAALLAELGERLHDRGRFREAMEAYGRAVALEPSSPVYLYNRARCAYALGRFEEALELATRADRKGVPHWSYQALRIGALRALARGREVEPLLREALRDARSAADSAYLLLQLATEQLAEGDPSAVLETLRLVRQRWVPPRLVARLVALDAAARIELGDSAAAAELLRRSTADGYDSPLLARILAHLE